jgi:hypothetical protein
VTGITEWHINADEPTVLDYNTETSPTTATRPRVPVQRPRSRARRARPHERTRTRAACPDRHRHGHGGGHDGRPYSLTLSSNRAETVTVTWGDGTQDTLNGTSGSPDPHVLGGGNVRRPGGRDERHGPRRERRERHGLRRAHGRGQARGEQVFGGGGNSGSVYRNDFMELFNAGDAPWTSRDTACSTPRRPERRGR